MFGTLAKAILCAALGQTPGDVVFSNSRAQKVEANFPESRRAEIRELLLYYSHDQGQTWGQASKILPEQREFQFSVPVDGTYWLRVAVLNREGKQEPENLLKGQPDWKLVIDTLRPLVRITSAVRTGNEVAVAWEIREDHPEWSTFRMEYQTSPGGPATPINNAAPGLTGLAKFNPNTNGAVAVKLTLKDKAGNESVVTADVANREGIAADGMPLPPQLANGGSGSIKSADFNESSAPAPILPAIPPMTAPTESLPPAPIETVGASIPGNPNSKTFPPTERPRTLSPTAQYSPVVGNRWTPNVTNYQPAPAPERSEAPIASTAFPVQQVQYQAPVLPPVRKAPLPELKYVDRPEVVLEYELSKVGPSGVGSVDIFLTRDDGQNWEHVANDPAVIGKGVGGRERAILDLPGDGVYGFSLVVKSKAQVRQEMVALEKKHKGPRSGDAPEIRVEVDTVPPTAELYPPRRDTAKANSLMLLWSADDKNLGDNPVALEWAERREGPWFMIANNLPNAKKYSWQLPNQLPVEVYLRIRVKDIVGNEAIAVTPDPQLVDLFEPEGHLVGVGAAPPRR